MNGTRLTAIVIIVASVLALLYGGFSYTKDTQEAKIGPIELTVRENKTVNIPVWVGIAGIVIGGALLLFGTNKGK